MAAILSQPQRVKLVIAVPADVVVQAHPRLENYKSYVGINFLTFLKYHASELL